MVAPGHRSPFAKRLCTLLLVGLLGAVVACGRSAGDAGTSAAHGPVMVFAAASLTAPFEALAQQFERVHSRRVQLQCAGTPQLVLQIREGAAADVFASADQANMQKVVDAGQVVAMPREFVRNRLAIVVARDNTKHVTSLADLARPDLTVALCGPEVPAGRYARLALAKANVVVHSVSDESNVKSLVAKIRLGEVDAGIAYVTDARGDGLAVVPIPEPFLVDISYPIAVLNTGREREGAEQFVDFVGSAAGQQILREHGFVIP